MIEEKAKETKEKKEKVRIFASPLARRFAKENTVDLYAIQGTAPHGRIVIKDVMSYYANTKKQEGIKNTKSSNLNINTTNDLSEKGVSVDPRLFYENGSYEEIPLNKMRRTIAKRLTQAKINIPHVYISVECVLDKLIDIKRSAHEDLGVKVSINDFIVKAAATALMNVPDVNVSFAQDCILRHKNADIGVAVSVDNGLITPIIRSAQTKSLREISEEIKVLAARGKERKLKPYEYEGGSFSVSNLGMFGVDQFCAIINPPQAAILAVGQGKKCVALDFENKPKTITKMTATLSCDHRAIDGVLGAQWLDKFRRYIENPALLIL